VPHGRSRTAPCLLSPHPEANGGPAALSVQAQADAINSLRAAAAQLVCGWMWLLQPGRARVASSPASEWLGSPRVCSDCWGGWVYLSQVDERHMAVLTGQLRQSAADGSACSLIVPEVNSNGQRYQKKDPGRAGLTDDR